MITSRPLPKTQTNAKIILELLRFQWLRHRVLIGFLLGMQIPGRLLESRFLDSLTMSSTLLVETVFGVGLSLLFFVLLPLLLERLANGDSPNSMDGNKGNGSAYPPYMLTLPVPDQWLIWVPMVFGVASIGAILGFSALLHRR
jgi:hypothetical protein